ncbi:hypothetical protein DEO72_LG3g1489 [Vigna unguiculata]|uniref:Uncharacterized protein n=2 Tax=Vigna unguiculata TaxID=3917 RepID=A0A4D6LEL6_VIGUN|nr:hypothetical protein DEO72_LG3g1489 [Vigna unguiculata]
MQENPQYGKLRYKGLAFAHQLTTLFKDVVANGKCEWTPSIGMLPTSLDINVNDVYCPSLEGIGLNLEEGSGDSKDGSVGAINDIEGLNFNVSQGTSSQGLGTQKNGEKRKRNNNVVVKGKEKGNCLIKDS